jgi:hypothetical protein
MNNLLPPKHLLAIFHILNRREIMFIFLHGGDPRYIIKRHNLEAEVLVVADFFDLREEGGQVGRRDVVYVSEEVCWSELCDASVTSVHRKGNGIGKLERLVLTPYI